MGVRSAGRGGGTSGVGTIVKCEFCGRVGDPGSGSHWEPIVDDERAAVPLLRCSACGHHQHAEAIPDPSDS